MLPTVQDLVEHEDLRAAIERTRTPAVKPDSAADIEAKKRVYV